VDAKVRGVKSDETTGLLTADGYVPTGEAASA
jgi:hypothetical protein